MGGAALEARDRQTDREKERESWERWNRLTVLFCYYCRCWRCYLKLLVTAISAAHYSTVTGLRWPCLGPSLLFFVYREGLNQRADRQADENHETLGHPFPAGHHQHPPPSPTRPPRPLPHRGRLNLRHLIRDCR